MFQLLQAGIRGRRNKTAGGQKVYVVSLVKSEKDLLFMKELLESGKVVPVIDGSYPLGRASDAFRYYEKEHARGKVVLTM
jgi:NADPH:quinone reductase-like Zn-dependent oxidoreductase